MIERTTFSMRIAMLLMVLVAIGLWSVPTRAQDDPLRGIDPHLIVDASSPRATLRSFLDLSREAIEIWRADGSEDRLYVLIRGLQDTLDFSDTANGGRRSEQVRRILLLREILDRTELPPWSEIPGQESAEAGLALWTIPGTRLHIRRADAGARAGSYVFGADTVEDLHLTYRRIRSLPYRAGSMPILEDWEAGAGATLSSHETELDDRLGRVDATSPRAVLTQFLRHVNIAYRIAKDAEARVTRSPPAMTLEEARRADRIATAHLLRASTAFDLSTIPTSLREDVRIEASITMKEILDRVDLPPIHEIPDASMVGLASSDGDPFVWRLPGLPVAISRIQEGDHAGSFSFDTPTLQELENTYRRLRDLPYRERPSLQSAWEWGGDDALSPGFLDFYESTPGSLVPSASWLGAFSQTLPDWANTIRYGQTAWQWLGLAISSVAAIAAIAAAFAATRRLAKDRPEPYARWILTAWPLAGIIVLIWAEGFVDRELNVTGQVLEWFIIAAELLMLGLWALAIWRAFMAIAASISSLRGVSERGIDASLVRILFGIGGIVAAVALVIAGLRDLGVDAVPLIAGLGVGGLAVALAIRPTLENLIGGLILHSDRPLRIGDFCTIAGTMGTIEAIGVRSTHIRALDRTLITIPNARLADMDIVNWAHCDRMLIEATLGLRYETTPDQIRHLLTKIRRMLHAHPKIDRNSVRVRYAGPAASSRDVELRIYALTRDWNEFFALREDVFLRVDDLVEASGVGYAFPSQTLYMARDKLPDAERVAAAEAEVAAWRRSRQLPFPRLSAGTMDALEGTLDYPPRGSVDSPEPEPEASEPLSDPERERPEKTDGA